MPRHFSEKLCNDLFWFLQVMETKNMIYIVSEYASQGEIFGEYFYYIINLSSQNFTSSKIIAFDAY